MRNPIF